MGLSPLPLAAYAAPPASPRGSGPLLRRAAGVPRLRLASPPSGFGSCSSVRFVVAALVRPLRPLRGLRACAAPGPERFACAAAPGRGAGPSLRPRPAPRRLRGIGLWASPRRARLCGRWPGPGLGLLAGLRLGGRGCPPAGPCSARRFPARVSSGPPALRPAAGPLGLCGGLGFSPAAPRPAAPAGGSRGPRARLGGLRPPPAARSAPPEGRASRAPLRRPAPVGAGPRGPLFSPVVNPEIVNLD